MSDITIPPEALEAGAMAILKTWHGHPWELADTFHKDQSFLEARAAFEAMVKNWPGMHQRTGIKQHESGEWQEPYPMLCLPLPPQEKTDGE